MGLLNRSANILSGLQKGPKDRPPFEFLYIYILALFTGYLMADLGVIYVRPGMLPTQPPPMRPTKPRYQQFTNIGQYDPIKSRNVFNRDGVIPPALTSEEGGEGPAMDVAPVLSGLPLNLQGTLVHANPARSVATITNKSKNEASAFMVDQEIEGMARITRIERRKVIFRNLNNNRLEYIEIPRDSSVTFGVKDTGNSDEVGKKSEFEFTMRRGDIAKYTADLGSVLQQARMVPNIVPGSGGRVEGFRFVAIQPGSIFEKLGFKPMDVLKSVNGEAVNSPTKGMELYNALRSESRINLTIERNGREENIKYDITE